MTGKTVALPGMGKTREADYFGNQEDYISQHLNVLYLEANYLFLGLPLPIGLLP
jgi:hypothetical protein